MCIDEGRPSGWKQTRRRIPGDLLGSGQKQFRNCRDNPEEPPGTRNVTAETGHIGWKQSRHGKEQRSDGSRYYVYYIT